MDENANHALMIAFGMFVFVIALTLTMYMFDKLSTTAEALTFFADETNYYDNVEVITDFTTDPDGIERYINTETIIPTLYRYYKEHFCVKIYDASGTVGGSTIDKPILVQILDVNLEGKVGNIAKKATISPDDYESLALNKLYNDPDEKLYMWEAPWLDSTDNMKLRLDFFINGRLGYINNKKVDYTENEFHTMLDKAKESQDFQFKEKFTSYSYTGESTTTEDGDVLVTGASPKDKIVITYTLVKKDIEKYIK